MELERSIKRSEQFVKLYQLFISALEILKAVATSFNGKVINKRFFDFVNEKLTASGFSAKISKCDRSYAVMNIRFWGDLFATYPQLTYRDIDIDIIPVTANVIENNRLIYSKLVTQIEKEIQDFKKQIDEKTDYINNGEQYCKTLVIAVAEYNKVLDTIPFEFRGGLHNLNYRYI